MRGIILGGGVTGLSAGISTGFPVYEAQPFPGGICRSYNRGGYHFNYGGGHWIFKAEKVGVFLNEIDQMDKYLKDAGVYFNQIIKSPIQKASKPAEPGTMRHWMHERFGDGLCRVFFDPFGTSYTAGLYRHILQDDPRKSPDSDRKDSYNDTFYYPSHGLSYLINRMAVKCTVKYDKKATALDLKNKVVTFDDGEEGRFDRLISTIPLREVLRLAGIQCSMMPFTSVLVLNIGATRGSNCPKESWLYIPKCRAGFFRAGFYSNIDATFAPPGKVSIYVEKAYQTHELFTNGYVQQAVQELKDWGWIKSVEVIEENWVEYAYTWMYKTTPRKEYLKLLAKHDVKSIGRYGRWKFQGIAESILDGMEV